MASAKEKVSSRVSGGNREEINEEREEGELDANQVNALFFSKFLNFYIYQEVNV